MSGTAKSARQGRRAAREATGTTETSGAPPGFSLERFSLGGAWYVVLSYPATTPDADSTLSRAELEVVSAVLRGETTSQIAAARGTTLRTIANQLASAYAKLRVGSRAELAARFRSKLEATPANRPNSRL